MPYEEKEYDDNANLDEIEDAEAGKRLEAKYVPSKFFSLSCVSHDLICYYLNVLIDPRHFQTL